MNRDAVAFGIGLGAAGWILSSAVAAARDERLASRLGIVRRPSGPGRLPAPAALRARAEARSWTGSPWSYASALSGFALCGGVVGWSLAGPVGGLAGAGGGTLAVEAFLGQRAQAGRVRAEESFREAILALASGTRAGLSIRRAIEESARDAGPPLDTELRRVIDRLSVGEPLEAALDGMGDRLALSEVRLLIAVLAVHRRTGGDLPAMLEEVAGVVADRVQSRREIRAITAQGRASGAVLAVLPVAFVALLSGTGGEALGAFYRTALGMALLASGLACEVLGFLWIRRIVRRAEAHP